MSSPRALLLRVAAVLVAVVTAAVVASDLAALHRHAHDLGPERDAVVARHALTLGVTIRAGDVTTRRVHAGQLPVGVLASTGAVVGRVVTTPVVRDGFVARANLAPRHRTGLAGAVPRGMRALRIVVTDALRPDPGAVVDVLASFDPSLTSSDSEPVDTFDTASVIARGVLVISVDAARTSQGASALGVTLLVTPHEARDLVFAATHGVVTLTLVPPEDAAR